MRPLPVAVRGLGGIGFLGDVDEIDASSEFTCARLTGGVVVCWGLNESGQLGDGGRVGFGKVSRVPVGVRGVGGSGSLDDAVMVSTGRVNACAVRSDGTVACWGGLSLGDGTMGPSSVPVVVSAVGGGDRLTDAMGVALGVRHACVVRTDRTVVCWGSNDYGQLGDGTMMARAAPVVVLDSTGAGPLMNVDTVGCGGSHTCVRLVDGLVRCWGDNSVGQLGDGTMTPSRRPVAVRGIDGSGSLLPVDALSVGGSNCVIHSSDRAACWGYNFFGTVGDGTMMNAPVPVAVRGVGGSGQLAGIVVLHAGGTNTCTVQDDARVLCWGSNVNGALGDGSMVSSRAVPGPVSLP
jgi:alpha-tubulin suppressor-like RCC1 family protein